MTCLKICWDDIKLRCKFREADREIKHNKIIINKCVVHIRLLRHEISY